MITSHTGTETLYFTISKINNGLKNNLIWSGFNVDAYFRLIFISGFNERWNAIDETKISADSYNNYL